MPDPLLDVLLAGANEVAREIADQFARMLIWPRAFSFGFLPDLGGAEDDTSQATGWKIL